MNEYLLEINPILAKVADGYDLTAKEAQKAFTTIFIYDKDGFYFTAFMSAIHAKGETADELVGYINTYKELAEPLQVDSPIEKVTDVSGTGGGTVKTVNVSTLVAFVVAAAGYTVAKATYYSITSPTGSADIFAAFGIDISKLSRERIQETLNEVGICPYYVPFFSPRLANRGQLFKKVYRDHGIKVRTTGHIATNAFSPFSLTFRIYGCYSEKHLEPLAQAFSKLGYERTLTFYGQPGIPEISNIGATIAVEQNKSKIKRYTLTPEELNMRQVETDDIKAVSKEQNIQDFMAILKGKNKGPKADLVAINAGASLYSLKDCASLKEGVAKAKDILRSGEGYTVLEKLTNFLRSGYQTP